MHNKRISTYPRNSPQAAARIVALALISNGKMQPSELEALADSDANVQLALTGTDWHDVVHDLCVDLLLMAKHGTHCRLDPSLMEQAFDQVDDVALQRRVLRLCMAVVQADGIIDDGESAFLLTVVDCWEVHPEEQPLLEPLLYGLDFEVAVRGAPVRNDQSAPAALVPCAMLLKGSHEDSHTD